ncbi:DUF2235 domain-containing protein [Alcaligenaceae bacterium CGII-47]|nr:DUF2235 domain-containing protein [Alcaligenaceae bacterium CGII-47]
MKLFVRLSLVATLTQLFYLICAGLAQAQGTCQAPMLGTPCAQGDAPYYTGAEPQLNLGIGNPIHLATGNKHQYDIDLPARVLDPFPGLARVYNAQDPRHSALGAGWQLALDARLVQRDRHSIVVQADGSHIRFDLSGGPSRPSGSGSLQTHHDGHQWIWPDGTRLSFDAQGALIRQHTPGRLPIQITRHASGLLAGAIQTITQGQHTISLNYNTSGPYPTLSDAQTPAGRFSYHYEHAEGSMPPRLVRVMRPDGMQRHYLYEPAWQSGNTHALTGLVIQAHDGTSVRTQSWFYDTQGRATTSIPGPPDSSAGRLDIEYRQAATPISAGHTRVHQASGQVTNFHFSLIGGRYALLSAQGAQCPACAATGTQARYDAQGRMNEINGTHIARNEAGQITSITPQTDGWAGLTLHYDPLGRRHAWQSALTGLTRTSYDRHHRPTTLHYANNDTLAIRYDPRHRPIRLDARHGRQTVSTHLAWQGRQLSRIQHPEENETRQYDAQGRLAHRTIDRPISQLHYEESLAYDAHHRVIRHVLPEGGSLHYEWGTGQQLLGLTWQDAAGRTHTVIRHEPGRAGYQYGNGLRLSTYADTHGRTNILALHQEGTPLWLVQHSHDRLGRLTHLQHSMPQAGFGQGWRYAYDASSRLIGVRGQRQNHRDRQHPRQANAQQEWLAWSAEGALVARQIKSDSKSDSKSDIEHLAPSHQRAALQRDPSGLPTEWAGLALSYGAQRRLAQISRDGQLVSAYGHNAFGHQIRQRTPTASTELFYLDNRVVAEWRDAHLAPAKTPFRITRRYLYAHEVPVGFIDWSGSDGPELFFIHADLLGAPRMVTDTAQAVRWLADATPGGRTHRIQGDLDLALRLPGQYGDPATGWHDNIFRTYDPQRMHYLEPDPLGPLPGHQALGYAAQQPGRYVDPLGLLLMAFDGTRNDRQTESNIWKLSQYYQDGPVFYHSGPGNEAYLDWDALTAWSAGQTIRTQWQSLLNALSQASRQGQSPPIDILGYSRGAALARHFANEIAQYTRDGWFSYQDPLRGTISLCVNLRFMGLFETVAQFGLLGINNTAYDLSIASAWQWVAHAVAANERRGILPLVSADPQAHQNTVESPFIGAHADIGGGVLRNDQGQAERHGDLSDVALAWMLWQARAASVSFSDLNATDHTVSQAILHDERSTASRLIDSDRAIQDSRGLSTLSQQGQHAQLGEQQRQMLEQYIRRVEDWRLSSGSEVGEVDMQGYGQWLEHTLGLPPLGQAPAAQSNAPADSN